MRAFCYVGLGGAVGAMARYGFSLLPIKGNFPFSTMMINILGAIMIGMITQLALRTQISSELVLLIKTGICGGFTTFSTFSLETIQLLEKKAYLPAMVYVLFSIGLCLSGVVVGMQVVDMLTKKISF